MQQHYAQVARETACETPLDLTDLRKPIVVVPIKGWDKIARKGLRFALKLSPEVYAVQVCIEGAEEELRRYWAELVEQPAQAAGLPSPQLVVIPSPYRHLFSLLLTYITQLKDAHPNRQIAVIIPQLVEQHWYHDLLHNQHATILKALLLLRGDQRVVVINVPWYLTA